MKRSTTYALSLFASIILASCSHAPLMTIESMNALKPGMTYEQTGLSENNIIFKERYKDIGKDIFDVIVSKRNVISREYSSTYDIVLVVFKNNLFVYTGHLDDLKKEDDDAIRLIGERISLKLIDEGKKNIYEEELPE